MAASPYWWHRQTIAETFERICGIDSGEPWVAVGDFLDDWRSSAVEDRRELVTEPIALAPTPELQRWAAHLASNGGMALLARWTAIPRMDEARELQVAGAVVSLQRMALARVAISDDSCTVQDAEHLWRRPHAGSRLVRAML